MTHTVTINIAAFVPLLTATTKNFILYLLFSSECDNLTDVAIDDN